MTDAPSRRVIALWKNELRAYRRERQVIVVLVVMPLILVALFRHTLAVVLATRGYPRADGAEYAVPGMSVTFGSFLAGFTGLSFFREHVWGTWDRLRASSLRSYELVLGKCLPALAVAVTQQAFLLLAGIVFFGLDIDRSLAALLLVGTAYAVYVIGLALLLVALCRTVQQMTSLSSVLAIGVSGIGGGVVPVSLMPVWAQHVAPLTPTYWTMRGYRSLLLDGHGAAAAVSPVLVLAVFSVVCYSLAAWRLRFADAKTL